MAEIECKKVKYANKTVADFDVGKFNNKPLNGRPPVRSYRCHLCDSWHITSKKYIEPKIATELKEKIKEQQIIINQLKEEILKLKKMNSKQRMELIKMSDQLYCNNK